MTKEGPLFSTIFILYVLLSFLHTSECLKCYVCNSVLHKNCGTSLPSKDYLFDCTDTTAQPSRKILMQQTNLDTEAFESQRNYTFCRKNIAIIPKQDNKLTVREGETRIVRSCGWLETNSKDTCKWGAIDGVHREMCTCTTSECNLATWVKPHVIPSLTSCLLLILISRIVI